MDPQTIVNFGGFAAAGPALSSVLQAVIGYVPAKLRPLVPVVLGVAAGVSHAISEGRPWTAGLLNGITTSGAAILYHDVKLKGAPAPDPGPAVK